MTAAIVGAGVMGRWHADAARRLGFAVVAVVDPNRDAAGALAARLGGAERFDELARCLRDRHVDVVHVCTPPETHEPLVRTALEHGCHVLVEKPLAQSAASTAALLDAARDRGLVVNPVHQFPFQRGVARILARRDELGELVRVAYRTSSAGGRGWPAVRRTALLREILPHPVSLFRRLLPAFDASALRVTAVQAEELALAGRVGSTYLDVFITLRGRPPCNELHVTGTRASAVADLFHGYSILDRGGAGGVGKAVRPLALGGRLLAGASANGVRRVARREPAYPGLRELVGAFYAAALEARDAPVPAEETLAAAALAERVGSSS